jgi:hypothetical protein
MIKLVEAHSCSAAHRVSMTLLYHSSSLEGLQVFTLNVSREAVSYYVHWFTLYLIHSQTSNQVSRV